MKIFNWRMFDFFKRIFGFFKSKSKVIPINTSGELTENELAEINSIEWFENKKTIPPVMPKTKSKYPRYIVSFFVDENPVFRQNVQNVKDEYMEIFDKNNSMLTTGEYLKDISDTDSLENDF